LEILPEGFIQIIHVLPKNQFRHTPSLLGLNYSRLGDAWSLFDRQADYRVDDPLGRDRSVISTVCLTTSRRMASSADHRSAFDKVLATTKQAPDLSVGWQRALLNRSQLSMALTPDPKSAPNCSGRCHPTSGRAGNGSPGGRFGRGAPHRAKVARRATKAGGSVRETHSGICAVAKCSFVLKARLVIVETGPEEAGDAVVHLRSRRLGAQRRPMGRPP
jgi:hypothetical protein